MGNEQVPSENQEPRLLGEILAEPEAVLAHEPDPERAAAVEKRNLEAEVDELAAARDAMREANQAGEEHNLVDINRAHLDARADLKEAVRRHPSNPPDAS